MFEKLIALFERFVTAHETLAANQAEFIALQKEMSEQSTVYVAASAADPQPVVTAEPPASPADPTPGIPANHGAAASAWNPFAAKIQSRYGEDKQSVLDEYLARYGVTTKASATGAEKHQALLDWDASKKAAPVAPAAPAATQEHAAPAAPVEEPAALVAPVTVDDVRALAQQCMAKKIAPTRVQDLLEQHGGSRKLPEVPADKLAAVYAAMKKELEA